MPTPRRASGGGRASDGLTREKGTLYASSFTNGVLRPLLLSTVRLHEVVHSITTRRNEAPMVYTLPTALALSKGSNPGETDDDGSSSQNQIEPPLPPPSPMGTSMNSQSESRGKDEVSPPAHAGVFSSKRVLTQPSMVFGHYHPADGQYRTVDNENCDLVMHVGMLLLGKYEVVRLLGCGTFGQVALCRDLQMTTGAQLVAVKVVKSNEAFEQQSRIEVDVIRRLQSTHDTRHQFVPRVLAEGYSFGHHAFALQLLGMNLYQLVELNNFKGLCVHSVREIAHQALKGLSLIHDHNFIHCDIKPENMLLSSTEDAGDAESSVSDSTIKIIDFGSSCYEGTNPFTYIQSRYYRAPEIIIEGGYTRSIDTWSLGCVLAEMFLGVPLLPGASDYHQLVRIEEMFGPLPNDLLQRGAATDFYYDRASTSTPMHTTETASSSADSPLHLRETREFTTPELPQFTFSLKSEVDFHAQCGEPVPPPFRRYFNYKTLVELVQHCPLTPLEKRRAAENGISGPPFKEKEVKEIVSLRKHFCDLLHRMLVLNPSQRIDTASALKHPFFSGIHSSE